MKSLEGWRSKNSIYIEYRLNNDGLQRICQHTNMVVLAVRRPRGKMQILHDGMFISWSVLKWMSHVSIRY